MLLPPSQFVFYRCKLVSLEMSYVPSPQTGTTHRKFSIDLDETMHQILLTKKIE